MDEATHLTFVTYVDHNNNNNNNKNECHSNIIVDKLQGCSGWRVGGWRVGGYYVAKAR